MNARLVSRPLIVAGAALTAGLLMTGCGTDTDAAANSEPSAAVSPSSTQSQSGSPSASPAPQGTTVDITVKGDQLKPNAKQVKVGVGDSVALHITSDRAGELHLHTTPDRHIEFGPGQTETSIKLARPGRIELEEHESGKLLVQFVVQ